MKNILIKKSIYVFIIILLVILLILSIIDTNINCFSKDNWIDIIMGILAIVPSIILSILVFNFERTNAKKQQLIETTIFNKELDIQLREERLKIFSTIMSLGTINIINFKEKMLVNFIEKKYEENRKLFNEIVNKEREITDAHCRSTLLFKEDDKILNIIKECFNLFVEYRYALNNYIYHFKDASNEVLLELKKSVIDDSVRDIPINILENKECFEICKEKFYKYYINAEEKENAIKNLITDKNIILAFDKYINIEKLECSK